MMRSQSSIEFLTTYSFLFLILGIIVSMLLFLASGTSSIVPQQCTAFGGPLCNFVAMSTVKSAGYALLTFSITNSQSVPINITSMNATIRNINSPGSCTPSFLYPGQEATCTSNVSIAYSTGVTVQGFYLLTARYCNSGISALSRANCTYEKVTYGGTFTTVPISKKQILFSVVASQSPKALQLVSYNSLKGNAVNNMPLQPNNYSILQNGDFVVNATGGTISYAFATNGVMLGQTYLGLSYPTSLFPTSASSLSNGNIACSQPYNSMLSIASTTLFIASNSASVAVSAETGGAMEMFYRQAQTGTLWYSVFSGAGWKSQSATAYGPTTITLNKGLYDIMVVWSNPCGSGGQVLKITGLPS